MHENRRRRRNLCSWGRDYDRNRAGSDDDRRTRLSARVLVLTAIVLVGGTVVVVAPVPALCVRARGHEAKRCERERE